MAASVTVNGSGTNAQNTNGSTVRPSGSASGNTFNVRNVGPVLTLNSAGPLTTQVSSVQNNNSTTTVNAPFNLTIQAVGGDIYFGTQAASTTFDFTVYENGAATAQTFNTATSSWSVPTSGVTTTGLPGNVAFKLSQNNSVTIPVTYIFNNRLATTGALVNTASYAVGLKNVKWSATGYDTVTSSFMSGQTAWRTGTISLP